MHRWPKRFTATTLFYKSKKYHHQDLRLWLRSEERQMVEGGRVNEGGDYNLWILGYPKYDCCFIALKHHAVQEILEYNQGTLQ